jgi:hypothetical protein
MKTALACLLLATLSNRQECEYGQRCVAELTVDFSAELRPTSSVAINTVEMWPGVYLAQWETVTLGKYDSGEVLVNGPFTVVAVEGRLPFEPAPGVLAMAWPSMMEVASR